MDKLAGKIALITGASRGIGRGCAAALAKAGADIAVNFRVQEEAAKETCSLVERLEDAPYRSRPMSPELLKLTS